MTTPPPTTLTMTLPPEAEEGHYADFANIWHTPDIFVLDFAAMTGPMSPREDETGQTVAHLDAKVVTRVRVPASQVFEIMKALEAQLSAWEAETGNRSGPADDSAS